MEPYLIFYHITLKESLLSSIIYFKEFATKPVYLHISGYSSLFHIFSTNPNNLKKKKNIRKIKKRLNLQHIFYFQDFFSLKYKEVDMP